MICQLHPPYSPDLTPLTSYHQILTCSVLGRRKSLQGHHYTNDKVLQNAVHQQLWRRESNFIKWQYLLLLKGGRRLLIKLKMALENNCALGML